MNASDKVALSLNAFGLIANNFAFGLTSESIFLLLSIINLSLCGYIIYKWVENEA